MYDSAKMTGDRIPLTCLDCGRVVSRNVCEKRCAELYDYLRRSILASVATREMSLLQLRRSASSLALLEVNHGLTHQNKAA